eukprot:5012872-Pyramimonas_sp.AAC.1
MFQAGKKGLEASLQHARSKPHRAGPALRGRRASRSSDHGAASALLAAGACSLIKRFGSMGPSRIDLARGGAQEQVGPRAL